MTVSPATAANPATALPDDPQAVFIRVDNLSLRFVLFRNKGMQLKEMVVDLVLGGLRRMFGKVRPLPAQRDEFFALQAINLNIESGMRLGIVGRNGAGKTTLLRTIAGIYQPTTGQIAINGSVAALIEIGSGFDPELTAYENILLGGALLGRSVAHMRRRADAIIEFAGVRDFAEIPIKYYSTGMNLRLAFAMATDVEPDVLLLDEMFAGGDQDFQLRATRRMRDLVQKTKIMVLVSHELKLVREFCTHALWLEGGRIRQFGSVPEVLAAYEIPPPPPPPPLASTTTPDADPNPGSPSSPF
ncbi:MAG: ABC transporter ATP-binding protein [Planctomycetota bacterium]